MSPLSWAEYILGILTFPSLVFFIYTMTIKANFSEVVMIGWSGTLHTKQLAIFLDYSAIKTITGVMGAITTIIIIINTIIDMTIVM